MNSAEIRQTFLDFFKSKQHEIVASASLLPTSPNLLFTNAGMNQFVPYFLGERPAPFKRAADTQKCIRAGGKHNDLEDVGFDTYHHTLFEMLGNWSFGDYFKKEAIQWSWELLTQVWKMPKERLYATVYQPGAGDPAEFDQEAFDYWQTIFTREGLDPAVHIVFGNKADNFWMMGETGPCGPCSELHIDLTADGDTQGKLVNADSPYCIEIWNLVFIQFNAEADGSFTPLSAKHVDTGMGFERVAGIMATTNGFRDFSKPPSNYDSDLFKDLFDHIAQSANHTYQATMPRDRNQLSEVEMKDVVFRVIADHIRTLTFSIADGILPGNNGRNYVLRRILRRAVLFGKRLDMQPGFFAELVDPVVAKFGSVFPELKTQRDTIYKVIRAEENAFDRTLDRGLRLFEKITQDNPAHIRGKDAFELYDTYGFPIDLTQLLARERGLSVDMEGFERAMQHQKELGQASQVKEIITVSGSDAAIEATEFVGYETDRLSNFSSELLQVLEGGNEHYLIFKATPFYAEMGGQVGDQGKVIFGESVYTITDTQKDPHERYLHKIAKDESVHAWVGKSGQLTVDVERRRAIQRHHSATHMLNHALRCVLGTHVLQAGSLVDAHHLRFDFSHFEAMTQEQIAHVEAMVNAKVLENDPIHWFEVAFDDKPEGTIATFGEKYGAVVRVVDIGGYSKELCGGTHAQHTGEMGLFKITSENAVAAGTRRIEAIVGESAYHFTQDTFNRMHALAKTLHCKPQDIDTRITQLIEQKQELEKKLKSYERKAAAATAQELTAGAVEQQGLKWIADTVKVNNPGELKSLAVQTAKSIGEGVVIMGCAFAPDKVTVVALCSPEAIAAGHKAGDIIRSLTQQLGGKGGGKPDFAMGGGSDADKLEAVLNSYLSATE